MATFTKRVWKDGTVKYRAHIRKKGSPLASRTFTSLEEAKAWADIIENQADTGSSFELLTLGDYIERYIMELLPLKKPDMVTQGRTFLGYWNECLGRKLASEVTPLQIEHYGDMLYKKGLTAETRRKYICTLNQVYKAAIQNWKWILVNPVDGVERHIKKAVEDREIRRKEKAQEHERYFEIKKKFVLAAKFKMKELGLVNSDVCTKVKMSKSQFQNVLKPEHNTTILSMARVAECLGIRIMFDTV